MTEYGYDVSTYPDLDPSGRNITSGRAVAECAARRLMTKPGLLSYTDDEDCIDLREYLSGATDRRALFSLASRVEAVVARDERVKSVSAGVVQSGDGLLITVQIDPVTGKAFKLVIATTAISVEVLNLADI